MHTLVLSWSLLCALVVLGYPLYLIVNSKTKTKNLSEEGIPFLGDIAELYSFDLSQHSNQWSFALNVPEITHEVLRTHLVLYYLETQDTCLKLPMNNASKGYTAEVFQNIGKVYLTFKCLYDGVSNYNTPKCHVKTLKLILIKKRAYKEPISKGALQVLQERLREIGVNLNNYEDTLGYLSNMTKIEFKGFRKDALYLPTNYINSPVNSAQPIVI